MASKSFKYRLEQVLKFKVDKEKEEQEKLAKLMAEEAHEKGGAGRRCTRPSKNVQTDLKTKRLSGAINIAELRWFPQHIKNLENKIAYQELRLKELAIRIMEQRSALTRAAMERQAYQKHKEKSHADWVAETEAEKPDSSTSWLRSSLPGKPAIEWKKKASSSSARPEIVASSG